MIARVAQWGNSLAVRIPSSIAKEISVEAGAPIDMIVEDGALVMRPVHDIPHLDLDELISRITDGNRHPETGTGNPVGPEF